MRFFALRRLRSRGLPPAASLEAPEARRRVLPFRWSEKVGKHLGVAPLRERLDLSLFVRRVFGSAGAWVIRALPPWRFSLTKEHLVHSAVFVIVGLVILTNVLSTSADRGSLLFALFSEAEIEEGAAPRARPVGAPQRNAFINLVRPAAAGGISEEDLEFELANALGGNALVETGSPETAETPEVRRNRVSAYTIREGDTPSTVAAKFGISTTTVLWANGIRDGDIIRPGDIVVILPLSGVLHSVVQGDDLTSLAQRYDAKVQDIVRENGLSADGAIRIGQKLVIPDGQIVVAPRRFAVREEPEEPPESSAGPPVSAPQPGASLFWPTTTKTISQYLSWRHPGIDISTNSTRPPVFASQDGTVAFSGWLGGYGKLIIVRHQGDAQTYYAHLSSSYVKPGQTVTRGEAIGKVGCTGRCTGNHVHWEYRVGGATKNPLRYTR